MPGLALLVAAAIPGESLFQSYRYDYHWTPAENAPTPAEATDWVEIYVAGERIEKRAAAGELRLVEDGSDRTLAEDEVRLRLNHLHRATRFSFGSFLFLLGAAVASLVWAWFAPVPKKEVREAVAPEE